MQTLHILFFFAVDVKFLPRLAKIADSPSAKNAVVILRRAPFFFKGTPRRARLDKQFFRLKSALSYTIRSFFTKENDAIFSRKPPLKSSKKRRFNKFSLKQGDRNPPTPSREAFRRNRAAPNRQIKSRNVKKQKNPFAKNGSKAEDTGLEPATPYGAPHFQ